MPDDVRQMIEDIDLLFNDWVEQCSIETMDDSEDMLRRKRKALALLLRKRRFLRSWIDDTWEDFKSRIGIS